MSKQKVEITAKAIAKIIHDERPTSLTGIAHALGHKGSVSGPVAKRIRRLVPDVADLLADNKVAKDGNIQRKPAGTVAFEMPDCVPFRQSSGYARVWAILFAYRDKGINKRDLVAKYKAWSTKPEKNCLFDITVVTSPRKDGSAHRSANKAADHYWVERQCDWFKMHLRSESQQ